MFCVLNIKGFQCEAIENSKVILDNLPYVQIG